MQLTKSYCGLLQELKAIARAAAERAERKKVSKAFWDQWHLDQVPWQEGQNTKHEQQIQDEDAEMLEALDALAECDPASTANNSVAGTQSDVKVSKSRTAGCKSDLLRSPESLSNKLPQMPVIWLIGDVLQLLKGTRSPYAAAAWSDPVLHQLLAPVVAERRTPGVNKSLAAMLGCMMVDVHHKPASTECSLAAYLNGHGKAISFMKPIISTLPKGRERAELTYMTACATFSLAAEPESASSENGQGTHATEEKAMLDKRYRVACKHAVPLFGDDVSALRSFLNAHELPLNFCTLTWPEPKLEKLRQSLKAQQAKKEQQQQQQQQQRAQSARAPYTPSKPPGKLAKASERGAALDKVTCPVEKHAPLQHANSRAAQPMGNGSYSTNAKGRVIHGQDMPQQSLQRPSSTGQRLPVDQDDDPKESLEGWCLVGPGGKVSCPGADSASHANQQARSLFRFEPRSLA